MSWRDIARPIVAKVLHEHAGAAPDVIKTALRAAYPFGPRTHHPYKIWLDEIRQQVTAKTYLQRKAAVKAAEAEAGVEQLGLFDRADIRAASKRPERVGLT